MFQPSEPLNPYQYLHRSELARLAWGIVAELRARRLRTAEERRDLTQRVIWMLSAYQWLTHTMDLVDSQVDRSGRLAESYMEHYLIEERRLRYSVLKQAEALVLGEPEGFDRWTSDTRVDGVPLGHHIHAGADGLQLALSVLEGIWNKMMVGDRATPRPTSAD